MQTQANNCNLPGWRWTRIKQLVLVGLSSSLHSEVCNALGGASCVTHSRISGLGNVRPRYFQLSYDFQHNTILHACLCLFCMNHAYHTEKKLVIFLLCCHLVFDYTHLSPPGRVFVVTPFSYIQHICAGARSGVL